MGGVPTIPGMPMMQGGMMMGPPQKQMQQPQQMMMWGPPTLDHELAGDELSVS